MSWEKVAVAVAVMAAKEFSKHRKCKKNRRS